MNKLTLDLEMLAVETFTTAAPKVREEEVQVDGFISRRSCIEQCTPTCVP